MTGGEVRLRIASPDDAAGILAVYAPYVERTAITFEYAVPPLEEFRARIARTLKKYPYIVAEQEGRVAGYAYGGAFVGRAAYDRSAETSIYLMEERRGAGLGKRLYRALEALLRAQNVLNLNACIACPEADDEYLTRNSLRFHAHMGWRMVGEFYKCGYKFGRWYNMAWMEKIIGEHTEAPAPFVPFPELDAEARRTAGLS